MSMKAAELREMSNAELTKKLAELKEELFNLRFQHEMCIRDRCAPVFPPSMSDQEPGERILDAKGYVLR